MTLPILFFAFSCSTTGPQNSDVPSMSESEYEEIFNKKTNKIETYSGLTNALTFSATEIDSEMIHATLARSARIYEWNSSKLQEETAKSKQNIDSKSEFFLTVYTPERNHNNLNSTTSIWKIYLDVNNQRYEGKATKVKGQLVDIQSVYPSHNRFSTPYKIEFPISLVSIANAPKSITLTGPKASAKVDFVK